MAINAYPLSWPEGWPRTPAPQRKVARFSRRVPYARHLEETK